MTQTNLGIIGISPGNGHPFSWAAIFNGYEPQQSHLCPFPTIPDYLSREKWPEARIPGAQVSHIWTQDPQMSKDVAMFSRIPHIVQSPEDLVGRVTAMLLARDDSENHAAFAAPHLKSGIPIYIDKPIATNHEQLEKILKLRTFNTQIFSCSALSFSTDIFFMRENTLPHDVLSVKGTTPKSWNTYAVHIADPIIAHLSPQRITKKSFATLNTDGGVWKGVAHTETRDIPFQVEARGSHSFGDISFEIETLNGVYQRKLQNTFSCFKASLQAFLQPLDTPIFARSDTHFTHLVQVLER